jgi:DNA-binding NarL/FixJ family response regulator
VVSVPHSRADCKAALETGADGVLLCAFTSDEFVEAIDMVWLGFKYRCRRAELLLSESSNGDLTLREIEVVRYLAGGHAYKEIADELGIAISTVKTHLKSIFAKLRANNRVQASCIVSERGITPVKRLSPGVMITPRHIGHR